MAILPPNCWKQVHSWREGCTAKVSLVRRSSSLRTNQSWYAVLEFSAQRLIEVSSMQLSGFLRPELSEVPSNNGMKLTGPAIAKQLRPPQLIPVFDRPLRKSDT